MLTPYGFGLLLLFLTMTAIGLPFGQFQVSLLGLAGLLWVAGSGLWFAIRLEWVARRLVIGRKLDGNAAARATIWTGQAVRVEVTITAPGSWSLPWIRLVDRPSPIARLAPARAAAAAGPAVLTAAPDPREFRGALLAGAPARIEYLAVASAPGRLRFEGVLAEVADVSGMFRAWHFLRQPLDVIVLPTAVQVFDVPRMQKPFHAIPGQGIHRHKKAGTSADLLDLRDYIPGDPPKTIAWKLSARKGSLITKQFESEVPVRCTIFVDATDSVRLGPPGATPLARFVQLAASLAGDLLSNRDPVGLCVIGGGEPSVVPAGLGSRQWYKIVHRLARIAREPARPAAYSIAALVPPAARLARELYPELDQREVQRPERTWVGTMFGVARWMPIASTIATVVFLAQARFLGGMDRDRIVALAVLNLFFVLAWWVIRRRWQKSDRVAAADRKLLASLFAALEEAGPARVAELLVQDEALAIATQRFLAEHQIAVPRSPYGPTGELLFENPEKLSALARHLLRGMAHGRDNELFILLVDVFGLWDRWEPLLSAIRVATARHHHVVIVAPLPAGVSLRTLEALPESIPADGAARSLEEWTTLVEGRRLARGYRRLVAATSRLGVGVICAAPEETVREVLKRVERVRLARTAVGPRRPASF